MTHGSRPDAAEVDDRRRGRSGLIPERISSNFVAPKSLTTFRLNNLYGSRVRWATMAIRINHNKQVVLRIPNEVLVLVQWYMHEHKIEDRNEAIRQLIIRGLENKWTPLK
jgi:hypothetical protein